MRPNQKRLMFGISAFAFLLGTFVFAFLTEAQRGISVLADLQANAKLLAPDNILADFVAGEPESAVIVLLQPTGAAQDLAAHSRLSAQVPAEFTRPGAPTYYNLQDESIRSKLQATVTETVNRVIGELGASGMTVTQRFSYQFGFAARVTPEVLKRIVDSSVVVAVQKDYILYEHLAQGIPLMNAATIRGSYDGSGVSIAICDTGIDTSHPRLGGGGFPNPKVIGGYDTGDSDPDPRPNSSTGNAHGTACAGIAAGDLGTVGDYIGGVAPGAKLYAVKISTGTSGSASTSAMVAGWEWCVTHKNDDPSNPILVISTSFGGGRFFSTSTCEADTPAMTTAAANAVAAGITIFASSGNDGYCDSMEWPACISYVNSVGAVYDANFGTYQPCVSQDSCVPTKTHTTTGCSSTGGWYATDNTQPDMVASYSNSASFLTLFAPSNQAYTTDIVGSGGYSSGDYSTSFGGTSAACPYAAGSAAVLQQAAKAVTGAYLTPAEVRAYLANNGDNIMDGKVAVTKPRINLGKAVDTVAGTTSTNILQNPGFESGNTVWIQESGPYEIITNAASVSAHTGSWLTWFGGYDNANDVLYQQVTIPSSTNDAYVQFWYYIATQETLGQYDFMYVEIRSTSNALLKTLKIFSNLDSTSGWVQSQRFSVTEFKGQTIRLRFHALLDTSYNTNFFVDDVTLMVAGIDNLSTAYVSKNDASCSGHTPCSSTIQNAIASASTPTEIKITQETYNENIILDFDQVISLQGGWDTSFASSSSYTTIDGSITISNGTMIFENIIVK